ncbi:hypothetical protein [Candidatus Electrothrix sp.]|uniref:hypothetical protein n=1 Tax=Candidatus Electrothrix sp. TaxID=2170559 RepID=UPI0040562333
MLLPREKPYLTGLNSYYLDIEKFIQHLQGEIGSGCLYFTSVDQELLIYFDEYDIVQGIIQESDEPALASDQLAHIMVPLQKKSFQVTIYYLDADSIFFWGQMPAFRRAQDTLTSDKMRLPDLIFRLSQKKFSGFIEVNIKGKKDCAVLFFHEGQRRGGSYYWGTGGLSASDTDYNTLLGILQQNKGTYRLGYFSSDPLASMTVESSSSADSGQETLQNEQTRDGGITSAQESVSELNKALNAFITVFTQTVKSKKSKTDPLIDLKLKFLDFSEIYSFLDPYNHLCKIENNGTVTIAKTISEKDAAEGIIDCAWMVVEDNKLHKKFRAALLEMEEQEIFQALGIGLER